MPHTENYCIEHIFELLHVLINTHHIPLLFSYLDSNNIVQTFGSKNLKEKWTKTWQNSNSWKQTLEADRKELNSSRSDVLDGEPGDALRNHQNETQPHLLPMPIDTIDVDELCDWLSEEIRREHIKKFGNPQARLLLRKPEFEPPWWLNSLWSWDSIKVALKHAKYNGEKKIFLRQQAIKCLDHYNIDPYKHVIPTYPRKEHKERMWRLYKIVVSSEDEHRTPPSSANSSSSNLGGSMPTQPDTTVTSPTITTSPSTTTTSAPASTSASTTASTTASTSTPTTASTTTTTPLTTMTSTSTSVGSFPCTDQDQDQDLQNTSFPSTSLVQSLQYDDNLPVLRVSSDLTAIQVNPVPNVSQPMLRSSSTPMLRSSSAPMLRSSSRTQTTSRSLTQMTGASSTDGRGPTLTSSPPSVRGLVPYASSDSSSSTSSKSHRSGPRSPASTVPGNRVSRSPSPTSPQTRVTSALPPSSPPPRAPPRTVSVTPPPPASPFQLRTSIIRRKTPNQLNNREDSDPAPPAKRRRKNYDDRIPDRSTVITNTDSFKVRNLSQAGLKNSGSSCCLNSVTFAAHRIGLNSRLVDISSIVNATDNTTDEAMVTYQKILRALPNDKAFSQDKFIELWNESTRTDDNRPVIGSWDDILLADSIFSELEKYQNNVNNTVPFFTKFHAKFQCMVCDKTQIVENFEKAFKLIPMLSPKTSSRRADRVSASVLLTEFMNQKFSMECPDCMVVYNDAKLHPVKGEFTCLAINRRAYSDEDGTNSDRSNKIMTKITDTPSPHLWGDPLVQELVAVIGHKGSVNSGHWVCYSKVEDVWYVNSDNCRPRQVTHPLKHNRKGETADLLIFRNY